MLRDKNLIPLSHQHQRALALCVRIDRASPIADSDVKAWQAEIAQLFQSEIDVHFAAEEQVLFPAASGFSELAPLVEELISDHEWLRRQFAGALANTPSGVEVGALAERLSGHIRKEERRLFESLQKLLTPEELSTLGGQLEKGLENAAQTCAIPTSATRLRAQTKPDN
jgi:hemerythrin-like domain-containing protein